MRAATHNYLAIWEFEVQPECRARFEEIYGAEGAWTQLFRRSPDFLGTKLVRDITRSGRYLTIDYWSSRGAFHAFKQEHADKYAALDRECERMTKREAMVGEFEGAAKPEQ